MKNNEQTISRINTKEMVLCAIFTALIIVGAFVKIPVPYVPLTLQVMFTNLAGMVLGARLGALSVMVYIILGLIGIPVFASGGGIGYVFSPTFGYLIGFVIGAYCSGRIVSMNNENSLAKYLAASAVNLLIVYGMGVAYLYLIRNFYLAEPMSLSNAIMYGALIPLPGDIITAAISCLVLTKLHPMIKNYLNTTR